MKKMLLFLGLIAVLAQPAAAFRPAGWVYMDYPWAYDGALGDWYWFNTPDTQWVVRMSNGQWAKLQNSALATGWVFYNWAFAYAQSNGAWHWINEPDTQWVANMRTAQWSLFGVSTVPDGMVLIPGGNYEMGDPFNEGGADELPVHTVDVDGFYMEKTEVPWALWQEVRTWATNNGYAIHAAGGKGTNYPAHSVSWHDAVKWCNARSEKEGLTPCYYTNLALTAVYRSKTNNTITSSYVKWEANGYRLPTEAEWEKAARGGAVGTRFPWSDTNTITHFRANYRSSIDSDYDVSSTRGYHPDYVDGSSPALYTSPVGSFAPNDYGLYDMVGNVKEWCWDRYSTNYYSDSPATNPQGPSTGSMRVVRGGSWGTYANDLRNSARADDTPIVSSFHQGFRCVRK